MSAEELALRRAERTLALWETRREVALGDKRFEGKILSYLSKAVATAERNLERAVRRTGHSRI